MRLLHFFRKKPAIQKSSRFSEFFWHASEEEKDRVFKEAARRANEEQRRIFEESRLKARAG